MGKHLLLLCVNDGTVFSAAAGIRLQLDAVDCFCVCVNFVSKCGQICSA